MSRMLIVMLFSLCSYPAWGAAYLSSQSGSWSTAATWGGAGVPGAGDTVKIARDHVVTAGGAVTVGSDAGTGSAAITLEGASQLLVTGALVARGDVVVGRGCTFNGAGGGTLTLDAGPGSLYRFRSGAAGSGQAVLKSSATSWRNPFTVQAGTRGGVSVVVSGDGAGTFYADLDFNYTKFLRLGDDKNKALYHFMFVRGARSRLANVLFLDCGEVNIAVDNGANVVTFDKVDFRDISRHVGKYLLQLSGSSLNTTGARSMTNITAYTSANNRTIAVFSPDYVISSVPLYNVDTTWIAAATGVSLRNWFVMADKIFNTAISTERSVTTTVVRDSVLLRSNDNQHYINAPIVDGCLFDGDGFVGSDPGDCTFNASSGALPTSVRNCIAINKAGVLVTAWGAGAGQLTCTNNTVVDTNLINVGESSASPDNLGDVYNNLIVKPDAIGWAGIAFVGGAPRRGFLTHFNLDYNAFWDCGAGAGWVPAVYKPGHPLAGQLGYLQGSGTYYVKWWGDQRVLGDLNAGAHDVKANPLFRDRGWTVKRYFAGAGTVRDVAREAVTINGWNFEGTKRVTPTLRTPANVLGAGRSAFTPTNPALKGAGHLGADIGAVPVRPTGH